MVAFAAMVGLITGLTIGDLQHENTNVVKENIVQKKVEKKFQHKGPVMLINDEVFPSVTPEKAIEIIEEYAKKTN